MEFGGEKSKNIHIEAEKLNELQADHLLTAAFDSAPRFAQADVRVEAELANELPGIRVVDPFRAVVDHKKVEDTEAAIEGLKGTAGMSTSRRVAKRPTTGAPASIKEHPVNVDMFSTAREDGQCVALRTTEFEERELRER